MENGKNGITPAVSQESVSTCAHEPIRMPTDQARLRVSARTTTAKTAPNMNECVKPTPGQPRWNEGGSAAEYTNFLVKKSGIELPATMARKEALMPTCFWMK